MRNTYFQFKQFTIHQDQCAMKVCTDACILGAWFSEKIPACSTVLDIGSGTGLLMLMLAQKHKGEIRGIELDLPAFEQLRENIRQSKWNEALEAYPGDVRQFSFPHKFDFIITNPPFYEGDLLSGSVSKDLAKHSKELTLAELLTVIDANLDQAGSFGILLPYHRTRYFESLAGKRTFHLQEKLLVRQTARHEPFRAILHFSRHKENRHEENRHEESRYNGNFIPETELVIKRDNDDYTAEFVELMQDYYLKL